ncbi:uncharacterized protein LOC132515484 [Lagenorhynchus albirostris]|uniref:uncharacterized protein LOC132515484 n=1 Tax=Lagenorhynchus albirostris TaxID=27610 RepID=UPI0028E48633|nr:uncharacterized protein LOC132515484 [Lagenorhynchus albirostris]
MGAVELWELDENETLIVSKFCKYKHYDIMSTVSVLSSGTQAVSGRKDFCIKVLDLAQQMVLNSYRGCSASGYLPASLAWHPQQSEVFVFECTPPATKAWYNPPVTPGNEVSCASIGGDNPPVTPGSEGFYANISGDSGSGGEGGGDGGSCGGDGDGSSGGGEGFCTGKADGIYSNPKDTTKFHQCVGGKTFHSQCAQGLVFHQNCKCRNWPSIQNVGKILLCHKFSCAACQT